MSSITYKVVASTGYGDEVYESFSTLEAAQEYLEAELEDTPGLRIVKEEQL